MLLKFRSAIEKASADMKDGQIKYNLYAEQKSTTMSVIDLLLTEYSNEGTGFIDLLQTENQLVQYDLMMLDAIVSSKMAEAEIERYIP